MEFVILIFVFFCIYVFFKWIKKKSELSGLIETDFLVSFTDEKIVVIDPDGNEEKIAFDQLTKIDILTTSDGPFAPDVFWRFYDSKNEASLLFPGGATGEAELLEYLQETLSGFDNDALIKSMGSTNWATFVIWKKS